jgi:hypothetical protein
LDLIFYRYLTFFLLTTASEVLVVVVTAAVDVAERVRCADESRGARIPTNTRAMTKNRVIEKLTFELFFIFQT